MQKTSTLAHADIKDILDALYDKFNRPEFIESDPICIPRRFSRKEDIEIAGFLSATIAWGQRSQIIKSAGWLMQFMDEAPYDFVCNSGKEDIKRLSKFYYRTFKFVDVEFFIRTLKHIYLNKCGLEQIFAHAFLKTGNIKNGLVDLHNTFTHVEHEQRSMKHLPDVQKNSSAKRLNMFLRWMIRKDNRGVDFGLWNDIPASALYIPLDVHTGRTSRELGLLTRNQNDWKSVEVLSSVLKTFDPLDPVKYDFALFGAGVEKLV